MLNTMMAVLFLAVVDYHTRIRKRAVSVFLKVSGMVPVNWLPPKFMSVSCIKFPSVDGMGPLN